MKNNEWRRQSKLNEIETKKVRQNRKEKQKTNGKKDEYMHILII